MITTKKQNQKLFIITGAGGLIGRKLALQVSRLGHVAIVHTRTPKKWESDHLISVAGDLTESTVRKKLFDISRSFKDQEPIFIHLAATNDVRRASSNPGRAFNTNVALTAQLAIAVTQMESSRFIYASSGGIYSSSANLPLSEKNLPKPVSIYAASKLAAESFLHGLATERKLPCDILRLSNVYAPESPENSVIGRILKQIRCKQPIQVMDTTPVRDFIFIEDVVEGFLRISELPPKTGSTITNLSTGTGSSIGEALNIIQEISGAQVLPPSGDEHYNYLVLANDLLQARTGWKPTMSLQNGLYRCLEEIS